MDEEMRRKLRAFARQPLAMVGVVVFLAFVIVALCAPLLAPYDPETQTLRNRLKPPDQAFVLGTDQFGRDVLSRLVWGSRVSLEVGAGTVLLGGTAGVLLGLTAGLNRWADEVVTRVTDILMAFPSLLLAMALVAALGSSLTNVIVALAVTTVPRFARVVRGSVLALHGRDFVQSARALGAAQSRILLRHLLPNCLGQIVVLATLWLPAAILSEASLSFLGLGVRPPAPTWGNMISEGKSHLINAPWTVLSPGVALILVVLAVNLVGDSLRDILDPRLRGEREAS